MGRKSREKKERRERTDGPVAELIAAYSTPPLLAVIDAASVSPTAAQRSPSLSVLFEATVRRRRPGSDPINARELPALVNRVAVIVPKLSSMEDWVPYDGRHEVLVPWNGRLFRMLPGSMERPTQVVRLQRMLASVIDPVIGPELGFGLADAGEVVLRRMDQVARALIAVWPDGPLADIGDEATVTEAEVAVISGLPSLDGLVDECRDPKAAARALDRFTVHSGALRGDALSMMVGSTFGSTVAVDNGNGARFPLPAGLLLETLPEIARELADAAVQLDPRVEWRWHNEIGNHLGHRLQGTSHRIAGPVRVGTGPPIHSVVFFDDRRILTIGNCAALTPEKKADLIYFGAQQLERVAPGVTLETPGEGLSIPDDAEVLHMQVTAGPMFTGPEGRMLPTFGVDDLEWILYSERGDQDDLWFFIRDLTTTPGIREQRAWDLIDKWEVWHPGKTFYRGAATLDFMSFAAHAAVAEWNEAASASAAEIALHRLDLRTLWDWPCIELRGSRGFEIADFTTHQVVQVLPWDVPVAINRTDPNAPPLHSDTLWRLSVGLDWKLGHSQRAFLTAAESSRLDAIRITFKFSDRNDGPALTVEHCDNAGYLTIGWDSRLQMLLAEDSFAVEAALGLAVAHVLAPPYRDAYIEAWNAAPPGIRIDGYSVRQLARGLPKPLTAHETLRIDVQRDLACFLRDDGQIAGRYTGADATALESGQVFPWLIGRLHETIAALDAESLLMFAMVQLECASYMRFMVDKRLSWDRGFPVSGEGAPEDRRTEVVRVTKVLSLIVEEVLARPPTGGRAVDETSWARIVAVADMCIESCYRSDAIHWRLRDVSVELSDLFEINIRTTGEPTDFDLAAYSAARAAATMPIPVPITRGQHVEPETDPEDQVPQSLVERIPQLLPIDQAMRSSLNFGIDAITGVLNVATQWDATDTAPVILADHDSFVAVCIELTTGATPDQYRAALDWLTLRRADLQMETIPHWESDRRARRITVCPFVEAGDGDVWVLPWTAESTMRILANYLEDGRLPWPPTALPAPVVRALGAYRQAQNDALEDVVGDALDAHGFVVRKSVKPEKKQHYGLLALSGEIDTLCIDTLRSRIWIVEVKDPTVPFSSRNMRRMVDDFHKPGRYVDKLLAKVRDVAASASSLAGALKIVDPDREWVVLPLVVTRRVDPAAFAVMPRIPFCVSDDVVALVDRDEVPAPGFYEAP